ncbi:MAG TPA: DUF4468 domain-containing protein [Puia sp.]
MKRLILLLFPVICIAQKKEKQKDPTDDEVKALYASLPKVDDSYEWTEVIQLDTSYKKDYLYRNAKLFFTDMFKSAKDVLQYDDKEQGKIVGKGNIELEDDQMVFSVLFTEKRTLNFSIEISCKDGKYKYRIYDINADRVFVGHGGDGPDNVTHTSNNLDNVYNIAIRGPVKKMERRLFAQTIFEINTTISAIKKYMAKQQSSSDF